MISSIVFINSKGEVLIQRVYKDDITSAEIIQFCTNIVAKDKYKELPIVNIEGTSFIHVNHKDIILLATTKCNVNAAMIIHFLYQLVNICKQYFGDFDEESILLNFILIYELLDEVMDFGIPQVLDPDYLKKFIQEEGEKKNDFLTRMRDSFRKYWHMNTQVVFRNAEIQYKQNKLFINIIESVNMSISAKGTILRSHASGKVFVQAILSGLPYIQLILSDIVLMDKDPSNVMAPFLKENNSNTIKDLKFHSCVDPPYKEEQKNIFFIPPDGEFQLVSYKTTENITLPFKIMPLIKESINTIEVRIQLKSIFEKHMCAANVSLKIPCPHNTASIRDFSLKGKAKYEPDQRSVIWMIKKFQGESETLISFDIVLDNSSNANEWRSSPISLNFSIPMFTVSGLKVNFLRTVKKSGYQVTQQIRYLTKSGEYYHYI